MRAVGHFLADSTRAALDRLLVHDDDSDAAPIERLAAIRSLLHELDTDAATLAAVRASLAVGATWEQIAAAAQLKPAAAKWRWQGADEEIAARLDAGRKRSARPSSVPTDLPGLSVAEAAAQLGVSVQAIYLQVKRGTLDSRTVELPDGRSYKRVFPTRRPDLGVLDPGVAADHNEADDPSIRSGASHD